MKSLATLLRIAKSDLETLRRALAALNQRSLDVEQRMRTLEQSVRDEQKAALRDYDGARAYGGFATVAVAARRALEGEAEAIEQESARLRVLITDAHVEMRKFERLLELQTERERAAREKREDAELDELATLNHARSPGRQLAKSK